MQHEQLRLSNPRSRLAHPPAAPDHSEKKTELPVSHTGGDDVAEESLVSEPWEAPSEAAILLKIESLDSGLTVLSRPGKGPSHKSSFSLEIQSGIGSLDDGRRAADNL